MVTSGSDRTLSVQVKATPEPGTLAMAGGGLVMVGSAFDDARYMVSPRQFMGVAVLPPDTACPFLRKHDLHACRAAIHRFPAIRRRGGAPIAGRIVEDEQLDEDLLDLSRRPAVCSLADNQDAMVGSAGNQD